MSNIPQDISNLSGSLKKLELVTDGLTVDVKEIQKLLLEFTRKSDRVWNELSKGQLSIVSRLDLVETANIKMIKDITTITEQQIGKGMSCPYLPVISQINMRKNFFNKIQPLSMSMGFMAALTIFSLFLHYYFNR